jgi:hypothetical protein
MLSDDFFYSHDAGWRQKGWQVYIYLTNLIYQHWYMIKRYYIYLFLYKWMNVFCKTKMVEFVQLAIDVMLKKHS